MKIANRLKDTVTVEQSDETKLKGTVTQASAERTVTNEVDTIQLAQLIPYKFDYISLSYTGDNLTGVVYKTGGAGGSTVATLALAYTGAVLDTVTRT